MRLRILLTVLSCWICIAAGAKYIPPADSDYASDGHDLAIFDSLSAADKFLTSIAVDPLEGIWEYPADETSLLILKSRFQKGVYDIYLYESVDCRFSRGMKVGSATASADPSQFSLSLHSKLRKDILTAPIPCAGKLSAEGDILYISAPKIKISVTPSLFLPTLWNTLRLSTRIRTEDPASKLPSGLRKVLPAFDGNPPCSSAVRYL
ncbi:MAG: hypothetical protein K2M41_07365 [Muribaculaceae bacterium]|nr:hypothetical protein [Muribaculaceae bacterium]